MDDFGGFLGIHQRPAGNNVHHTQYRPLIDVWQVPDPAWRERGWTFAEVQSEQKRKEEEEALRRQEDERKDRFERAEMKTQVFDTYAVCASLLAGFSVSAYWSTDLAEIDTDRDLVPFVICCIHKWLVRGCTAAGIYAVIVFSFCAMYTRTALARPKHSLECYDMFNKRSGTIRMYAFFVLYYTSLVYSFTLVLSCFYTFREYQALVVGGSILVVLIFTFFHSRVLMNAASLIFLPDDVVDKAIAEAAEKKKKDAAK